MTTGEAGGDFDVVVVVSAVYMARWLSDAAASVRRNQAASSARPLWLFSIDQWAEAIVSALQIHAESGLTG